MSSKGDTQGKKHTEEKNSIFPYVKRKKKSEFFLHKSFTDLPVRIFLWAKLWLSQTKRKFVKSTREHRVNKLDIVGLGLKDN